MAEDLEALFDVDGRPIVKNSIHPVGCPQALTLMVVVDYDPETERSTWLAPLSHEPGEHYAVMRMDHFTPNFEDSAAPSGKRFLEYHGQVWPGTTPSGDLTPEQRTIFENWFEECEKAGYGGLGI